MNNWFNYDNIIMIMSQYNFVIEILQHGNKCFNIFEIDRIMHGDIKPKYNSTIVIITILLRKQATTLFKSTYNISLLLVAFNFSDFGYKLSFKVVLAREREKCYNAIINVKAIWTKNCTEIIMSCTRLYQIY